MRNSRTTDDMDNPGQRRRRKKKKPSKNANTFVICAIVVIVTIIIVLSLETWSKAVTALTNGYMTSYQSTEEETYNSWYEKFFEKAENEYHLSNRVSIAVEKIKATATLEVLAVQDTEFVAEEAGDNEENIVTWLSVPGEATYTVNLKEAEFIVDSNRAYVLVRVPSPVLGDIQIKHNNVKHLFYDNDFKNEGIQEGFHLAKSLEDEAVKKMRIEFESHERYAKSAKAAAESAIELLVRQFNTGVDDLTVDVEFFDVDA